METPPPASAEAPPPQAAPSTGGDAQVRQWAMFLHFSQLLGFLIPFAGLIAPIVIWQIKKNDMPAIDAHGKVVVNWMISLVIYFVVSWVLMFVVVGIFLMLALALVGIIFPIIGGIKANNGELWKYPMSLNLIK